MKVICNITNELERPACCAGCRHEVEHESDKWKPYCSTDCYPYSFEDRRSRGFHCVEVKLTQNGFTA